MYELPSQAISSGGFAQSILPLFNGPFVKLRVASSTNEYDVSVNLLSAKSSYFAGMFQSGHFAESIKREATLEDMDGVVSPQSLENLLQWIYREKVCFTSTEYPDVISEMLEFLRIADMCDVHGMEQVTADYLADMFRKFEDCERPANMILPQHIASAGLLPNGHPFRLAMAKCMIRHFVEDDQFQFFDELSQLPGFSTDVLKLVRNMLRNGRCTIKMDSSYQGTVTGDFLYKDPLFEENRKFHK